MIKRIAITLLILCGFVISIVGQTDGADCEIDLSAINALLAEAGDQLDADNPAAALDLLAEAQAELEATLARCTGDMPAEMDVFALDFSETTVLRRALPDGDVLLRYPTGWTAEIGDGVIAFANDPAAIDAEVPAPDHIVGVMTALTSAQVTDYGVETDFTSADALEVLALTFVGAYDDASLGSAADIETATGAVLTGSVTEDGLTVGIAFALVPVGEGYTFIVLTIFDEAVDAAGLMTLFAETVTFLPDGE